MTQRITRDHVFYAFDPALQPVVTIKQGVEVVMETHDCFHGQLKSEKDLIDKLDWDHVNPATGPVCVEGVKAGDILRVDIIHMKVDPHSVMVTLPGEGALRGVIKDMETVILDMDGDQVVYKDKVHLHQKPMIGVIGVAPESGQVATGTPGPHGGNMDCTLAGERASLYFTAGVDGALFGAGDFHSVMGDGEIVICGAEVQGEFTFKAQVVNDLKGLPTPFLKNDTVVATIFSAATLDEAASGATHAMANFLTSVVKLPVNDAGMLMSIAGNLKFCQIVDPEKTVRFEFPIDVLDQYGFKL